jgi:predicted esterase
MIINAIGKHLSTIIILHGMNQDSNNLYNISKSLQDSNKHIKVIVPDAPIRTITWPQNPEKNVRAWYNYYTRNDGLLQHDDINQDHFLRETKRINNIIKQESALVSANKIIICGISQGGTLAFNIALHSSYKLGAMIGLHTIFMDNIISTRNVNQIPIFLFSGREDEIYNIKLQRQSIQKLLPFNGNINWHIEKNLKHCQPSSNETKFIINVINSI